MLSLSRAWPALILGVIALNGCASTPDEPDPAQVKRFEEAVDLKSCLFLVSSKSGSTLEPNIFKAYFYEKAKQAVGEAEA